MGALSYFLGVSANYFGTDLFLSQHIYYTSYNIQVLLMPNLLALLSLWAALSLLVTTLGDCALFALISSNSWCTTICYFIPPGYYYVVKKVCQFMHSQLLTTHRRLKEFYDILKALALSVCVSRLHTTLPLMLMVMVTLLC